jgi:hypothetical protein
MGLALPDVEEGTMYGAPAPKVHGSMFACVPSHKSAEPDSLPSASTSINATMLAADPNLLPRIFVGYPASRPLESRHPDALRDLPSAARRFVLAHGKRRPSPRKRR